MARRQVSIFINGKEVARTVKSITAEKRKLVRELNNMVIGSEEYEKQMGEIKKLEGVLGKHRKSVRGIESSWSQVTKGAVKFLGVAGLAFGASEVLQYGKELFKTGVEMDTLARKAETVLGTALSFAASEAREHAAAMGLTNAEYVAGVTNIADMLVPMGFYRKEAAEMSVDTVNLAGAMAEWTGGIFTTEETLGSLRKALVGEREELERYGIKILQSELNTRLLEKGMKDLTGQAKQQAEALAVLELISEKSADAQAQYAQNSESLVRKQAELQSKIKNIQETIATGLVPVWDRLIDVVGGTLDVVTDFIETPMVERLQEEQTELNSLVLQITEANISQDRRNKLIGELQRKYPDFLGNLDAEKVTNEQLASRLGEVNNQYILKIALQKEDDKIQKQSEKVANVAARIAEEETRVRLKQIELNEKMKLGLDFTNKSLQERNALLRDALLLEQKRDIESGGDAGIISRTYTALLQQLDTGEAVLSQKLKAQQTLLAELEANRRQVEESITASLGISADGAVEQEPGKPEDDPRIEYEKLVQEELQRLAGTGDEAALMEIARRERLEEDAKKRREKAVKELQQQQQRLNEVILKFQEERRLALLKGDEKELEQVRLKYQQYLEVEGITHEQRLALERLRDEELAQLRDEQSQAETDRIIERLTAQNEAELEAEERFREQKQEIKEELSQLADELFQQETETEMAKVQERYDLLLEAAQKHGVDLQGVFDKVNKNKLEADAKAAEEKKKIDEQLAAAEEEVLFAKLGLYKAVAAGIAQAAGDNAAIQTALVLFQKGVAAAEVIINLQKEVAAINAQTAALGIPGIAIGKVLTTAARIRAATSLATIAGTAVGQFTQRKEGGFVHAKGADDGITYKVLPIGQPSTGMLDYPHPVLVGGTRPVIANEAGPEYYVAHHDLRKPAILQHVRAIENIKSYKQFNEGGFNAQNGQPSTLPEESPTPSSVNPQMMELLTRNATFLELLIEKGVYVLLDDNTLLAINNRLNDISAASGGRALD